MVHRQHGADLAHLLIRLLRSNQVVDRKDNTREVPYVLIADLHGGPEPSVKRGRDPCCAEVGAAVEVREGLGGLEADDLGEVAADVEPEEGEDDGLPGGQAAGEAGGEAANEVRAMFVTSVLWSAVGKTCAILVDTNLRRYTDQKDTTAKT